MNSHTPPLSIKAEVKVELEDSCKDCCPDEFTSRCCVCFCGRRIRHKMKEKRHQVWNKSVEKENSLSKEKK